MTKPVFEPSAPALPELLLPAGDFECVAAAVQNGADAVYLGGKDFSARQNAGNFDSDGLFEAVAYCHARGVKVYQTLNTLIFDRQADDARQALLAAEAAGVDALILQDWGLLRLARAMLPRMRLHASTQMAVHTPAGARLLREMGVCRVVLAREMSSDEIREVAALADIETEVFVHGALCMSVSGQCYLSGMLGGRSGNRGVCAGTCRLPFTAAPGGDPLQDGGHALSLKDLCLGSRLDALQAAGVRSLKVEGRMKRPEYVAAAAAAYRAALDGGQPDWAALRSVFSRSGFTDGYLTGERKDMFGIRQKDDVTAATDKLLRSLRGSYQKERGRIPLRLAFACRAGSARLTGCDPDGHQAEAEALPLPASGRPLAAEAAQASLQKLGGTIFCPGAFTAEIDEGLFLPASELNRMRREVCDALYALRITRPMPPPVLPVSDGDGAPPLPASLPPISPPGWRARFSRFEQLSPDWPDEWLTASLPAEELLLHADELFPWRDRLYAEPERALFGRESTQRALLTELRERGFCHVLCQNLGHLALARELCLTAHGGVFLNCANSQSAAELAALGAASQTLSFELNLRSAREVQAVVPLGLIAYGRLPLMLTRNCPVREQRGCGGCEAGPAVLTDRLGVRFPVVCRQRRYAELLNSAPLWLADRLGEFSEFSYLTFYFTTEAPAECRRVRERYSRREPFSPDAPFTRGLYYRQV